MAKCSFHKEFDAVEKCTVCGKEMCKECAPKFIDEKVVCPVCALENNKKERKNYGILSGLVVLGMACAIAVLVLLTIMIVRGDEHLTRNIICVVGIVLCMSFAVFLLINTLKSFNYYNGRYKLGEVLKQVTALTTTSAEPKEEAPAKVTTTTKKAEEKATAKVVAKPAAKKAGTKKTSTK